MGALQETVYFDFGLLNVLELRIMSPLIFIVSFIIVEIVEARVSGT